MTICFVFKNGFELKMKCKSFSIERNIVGEIIGYKAEGITENKILFLDFNEIICVYRVLSNEVEE